ncbi:hypothetical protein NMY22_g11467 [Coprinellus aureogranulatus]|nr:hypothetical protein NMY22_g11467 [Coprinellus aureogranulatus]
MPNLVQCEIAVENHGWDINWHWEHSEYATQNLDGAPIQLLHLQTLKLHGRGPSQSFLSSLDLPALRQLRLLESYEDSTDDGQRDRLCTRFVGLMVRFGSQLTNLRFSLFLLGDTESTARCLKMLSQLDDLYLDSPQQTIRKEQISLKGLEHITSYLMAILTMEDEADRSVIKHTFCPKLRRFSCTQGVKGFDEIALMNFISGRRQKQMGLGFARIEEVDVSFAMLQQVDLRTELEKGGVDMCGFKLRLKYPDPVRVAQSLGLDSLPSPPTSFANRPSQT